MNKMCTKCNKPDVTEELLVEIRKYIRAEVISQLVGIGLWSALVLFLISAGIFIGFGIAIGGV